MNPVTAPPLEYLTDLLTIANNKQASDLMLSTNQPAMFRIDGAWRGHEAPLDARTLHGLTEAILTLTGHTLSDSLTDLDTAFKAPNGTRVRANVFRTQQELAIVLRIIPSRLPDAAELGLPQALTQLATKTSNGLILITGATGSGKSTTIAALIDTINRNRQAHVITLEDPIEYQHTNLRSVIHQRQVGLDTPSFELGLRSALRQSPDVLVIGELRDLEAMKAAITAAETGHLVLGTLHTNGTEDTINRLIDSFPAVQQNQLRLQLAHTLVGIFSQTLIPQLGGGRVLAHELMINTPAIRNLIKEARTNQIPTTIQASRDKGMSLLEQNLADLLKKNQITRDSAYAQVRNRETLDALLKQPARTHI